ncbi:MAG: flagellar biosynthesis protein FlhB [Clostridiales bacterium]|nr:flagellar biosynthesis protein FlhB [Clostridiales bacterium]
MAGERTEKATPKRRQDERKKGNIFQSREIVIVASLLVSFYSLKLLGPHILKTLFSTTREIFILTGELDIITFSDVRNIFVDIMVVFATTVLPLLMLTGLVAIVVTMAQTRLLVRVKPLGFKMGRLSPLQGIKKMFSLKSVIEILKSILKIVIISYIIYKTLFDEVLLLPRLMDVPFEGVLSHTGKLIMSVVTASAIAFVAIAALDYLYQWWDYERNIKMTKQEIKEEYKETEGDPQIKSAIKSRQQSLSRSRMMQNVPQADVVIRNPTHYAVAIKYDPDADSAPRVVAKGAGYLALRIIEEAEKHGVIVTENRTLARGLYEAVEIEQEIPSEFYHAVAETLVFVYRLREEAKLS